LFSRTCFPGVFGNRRPLASSQRTILGRLDSRTSLPFPYPTCSPDRWCGVWCRNTSPTGINVPASVTSCHGGRFNSCCRRFKGPPPLSQNIPSAQHLNADDSFIRDSDRVEDGPDIQTGLAWWMDRRTCPNIPGHQTGPLLLFDHFDCRPRPSANLAAPSQSYSDHVSGFSFTSSPNPPTGPRHPGPLFVECPLSRVLYRRSWWLLFSVRIGTQFRSSWS